jgi:hypothetical protein
MHVIRDKPGVKPSRGPAIKRAPSIFDGETLPDFIDPLVERIEPRVQASVLKIKKIADRQKPEKPVVAFDVDDHLFDRVTDGNDDVPHGVHHVPPFRENDMLIL